MALPLARDDDFFGGRKPPADARPEHLRIINDSALRARLIGANIAVGLQSPKGPQRIASIIRVYPNFDAPTVNAPAGNGSASPARHKAGTSLQPTIEELEQLITRVRAVEGHVAREMHMAVDAEIERLRRKLGEATPEQIEDAHSALGAALDRRRAMSTEIRREAYRRIERDHEFPPRVYIRLLAE
jgi:hypothetical protein